MITATEQTLAVELTAIALREAAPDELPVLEDSAEEYYADPAAAVAPSSGDEPLGAGIEIAMLTPYLLSAAGVVLPMLGAFAGDLTRDIAKDLVKDPAVARIRSMFRRPSDGATDADGLTTEQIDQVRVAVTRHCRALGLPPEQVDTVAAATVGSLARRP